MHKVCAWIVPLLIFWGAPARAENLALDFDAATAQDRGFVVPAADVRGRFMLRTRALLNYSREPLVIVDERQNDDAVVREQMWLHAMASLALWHRFLFGLEVLGLAAQSTASAGLASRNPRPEPDAALGDLKLSLRAKILGPSGPGVHLTPALSLWLPTGSESAYASDGALRVKPGLLFGGFAERFAWATELSVALRESARIHSVLPLRAGNSLLVALGTSYLIDPQRTLRMTAETRFVTAFSDGATLLDTRSSGLEFLVGSVWRAFATPFELGAAFGPGIGQAPGTPDYRALVSIAWVPEEPPPPPDRDDDGVPDATDICLELPGVPSSDPLMDGCPEVPPDSDGDSIPNAYDACPTHAGVPTGKRRTHGCPEARESDTAPAPPTASAELVETRIVISEQVQFQTGTAELRPESDAVLSEVVRVLREHPEIEVLEVEGHTDDTGDALYNQKLSSERAESVVKWLVARGVEPRRLVSKGYGATQPLAGNDSEAGRARNRRVAFTVQSTVTKPEQTP